MFHRLFAASDKRVYAVLESIDRSASPARYQLSVATSDDGGATWNKPVVATDVPDPTIAIMAPSIAIDAGDPNTVYVAYTLDAGKFTKTSAPTLPESGQTLAISVSNDGGKTFKSYVLESHVSGWEEYGIVSSPGAGKVVVEAPTGLGDSFFRTFTDDQKGAGFAKIDETEAVVLSAHNFTPGFNDLKSNGGSAGLESPRLISDGKGRTCITYVGGFSSGEGDGKTRLAVQCSNDGGATFGNVVDVDYEAEGKDLHHPSGAFGPSGELAIAYWADGTAGNAMYLATSKNGGTTFGAPTKIPAYALPASVGLPGTAQYPALAWEGSILWVAYEVGDGVGARRLVVDKSCDGGTTWSGAQLINGPEPEITQDYQWAGLFVAEGKPHVYARKGSGSNDLPVAVFRLVP